MRRDSFPPCGSCGAAILLAALLASEAHAQGTARSLDLDPSVRAAGMGLASNAVFWDEGANHWGNPSLLGYQRGIRYEWSRTRLVPGLAPDVFFKTNVLKLGHGGFAVALSGKPLGLGGLRVDYGESQGVDDQGNQTSTFESWEDIEAWSLGFSCARLGEEIARHFGHDPATLSRYGDFSFGITGKHCEIQLGPESSGHAKTSAHDLGFLVRLSPLEMFAETREFLGLDLAYGWSRLSYDGEGVVFVNEGIRPRPRRSTSERVWRHARAWIGRRSAESSPVRRG